MPQAECVHDEVLIDLNSWQLICFDCQDFGAGLGISHTYPVALVYSFECNAGTGIGCSWHPSSEAHFGRLMAYAAAVKWDAEWRD